MPSEIDNCLLGDQEKVPLLHVVNHFTAALLYLIPFCSTHLSLHQQSVLIDFLWSLWKKVLLP